MFELNQAIAEWRQQMAAGGIKSRDVLDELESHLREDAEKQIRSGADAEQAFNRAVGRIGARDKLAAEFGKIDNAQRTRTRMLLQRWSVVAGTAFVYSILAVTWFIGARQGKIELTWVEVILALGAMAPLVLLGWAGRSFARFLPVIHEGWVMVIAFAAIFSGAVLLRIFFNQISPANLVEVQIITLWILSPTPGFGSCVSAWYDRSLAARRDAGTINPQIP